MNPNLVPAVRQGTYAASPEFPYHYMNDVTKDHFEQYCWNPLRIEEITDHIKYGNNSGYLDFSKDNIYEGVMNYETYPVRTSHFFVTSNPLQLVKGEDYKLSRNEYNKRFISLYSNRKILIDLHTIYRILTYRSSCVSYLYNNFLENYPKFVILNELNYWTTKLDPIPLFAYLILNIQAFGHKVVIPTAKDLQGVNVKLYEVVKTIISRL